MKIVRMNEKLCLMNGKLCLLKLLGCVCFSKTGFRKITFQTFLCLTENTFQSKKFFFLVSRKVFSFYFGWKTLSGSCEKFRNVILFTDYIKFGPHSFNYYLFYFLDLIFIILIIIYFIWDNLWNYIFFQFHSHSTF